MSVGGTAHGAVLGYGGEPVLRGLDFSAAPGSAVCVLGPNGGGKTTLFRALAGRARSAGGGGGRSAPAYVAQTERTRLDFPVSALDVALMGALANGRWWLPARRSERTAAREALARVGLESEARTRFGALSGGQRQRVLIARALVQDAPVLLLDEPLAGIDPASAGRSPICSRTCATRAARCSCRPTTWRAPAASTSCCASTAARWPSARRPRHSGRRTDPPGNTAPTRGGPAANRSGKARGRGDPAHHPSATAERGSRRPGGGKGAKATDRPAKAGSQIKGRDRTGN